MKLFHLSDLHLGKRVNGNICYLDRCSACGGFMLKYTALELCDYVDNMRDFELLDCFPGCYNFQIGDFFYSEFSADSNDEDFRACRCDDMY